MVVNLRGEGKGGYDLKLTMGRAVMPIYQSGRVWDHTGDKRLGTSGKDYSQAN